MANRDQAYLHNYPTTPELGRRVRVGDRQRDSDRDVRDTFRGRRPGGFSGGDEADAWIDDITDVYGTIAGIDGFAIGVGLQFALGHALRIASYTTTAVQPTRARSQRPLRGGPAPGPRRGQAVPPGRLLGRRGPAAHAPRHRKGVTVTPLNHPGPVGKWCVVSNAPVPAPAPCPGAPTSTTRTCTTADPPAPHCPATAVHPRHPHPDRVSRRPGAHRRHCPVHRGRRRHPAASPRSTRTRPTTPSTGCAVFSRTSRTCGLRPSGGDVRGPCPCRGRGPRVP